MFDMTRVGSDDLLKQNVFSSIHMSSEVKTGPVTISYPSCSFCGGYDRKSNSRKVLTCQLTLYSNPSDSFVVWSKKPEEPKGILWLRSCCIKRGTDTQGGTLPVELISKGCRGRCSYTLRFTKRALSEEWYRNLRLESRKNLTAGDMEEPFNSSDGSSGDEGGSNPLDEILSATDVQEMLRYDENKRGNIRRTSSPIIDDDRKPTQNIKKSTKKFRIPFTTSSIMDRKVSLPAGPTIPSSTSTVIITSPTNGTIITNTPNDILSPDSVDTLTRWSWPVKV